jgi:hypothetical protein
MMASVPKDSRPQYSMADVAFAVGRGANPAGFEQIGADRYVQAIPPPRPARKIGPAVVADEPEPKPKSAAEALWPNMKGNN